MNIRILAKSSSEQPYQVDFVVKERKLTAKCNCKAGIFGNLCKHKTELLAGNQSRLFDVSEMPKLEQLTTLLLKADELGDIAEKIAKSETIIRQEQANLKKIKKDFSDRLKSGIPIIDP